MKTYMCIDLKSFYASVECVERGLNPLDTNLVVADSSRTEKTICLAVTPSLKQYGLSGRSRLYEVVQKVKEINKDRLKSCKKFTGKSYSDEVLQNDNTKELDYIIATPRMRLYMKYSTDIYNIYLKYISRDDIYVYSIDEVFIDVTHYLEYYKMSASELVTKMIQDVYETTGITATAGIGTNMYLAKVAMDIVAKHAEANEFGVRLAELDEQSYRTILWTHKPITDFWRVGRGYAKRLEEHNMYTMGDVAECSHYNEDLLYKLFGVNAETLIDHAWGYEDTNLDDIRKYRPTFNSISSGQVLHRPYNYKDTKLILREMADLLSLDLVEKRVVTDQIVLDIGYDVSNLTDPKIKRIYDGEITTDMYGRPVPKHAHGTINIDHKTSSTKILTDKILELYDRIIDFRLYVRRVNITACKVVSEELALEEEPKVQQYDLFTDYDSLNKKIKEERKKEIKERELQHALLDIKNKYGKNAILKGMNLEEAATTISRNEGVGGHKG